MSENKFNSSSSEYSSSTKKSEFETEVTDSSEYFENPPQIINEETIKLHELLEHEDIEKLYELFKKSKYEKFDAEELREILEKFNIFYTDKEFNVLFLKLNTNRDQHCNWDEFISHIILGFQEDDPYNQKETLNLPIHKPPIVRRAIHRHPIIRILFCPTVLPDRSVNNVQGSYITASKDGIVNYWSADFEIQRTGKSKSEYLKVAQTWILDVVCLPDVRIVCTSSTERDLRFYDTTANNFHLRVMITSLPWAVNKMFYYFNKSVEIDCKLILGDFGGNIRIIEFNPKLRGPFQSKPGTALVSLTYRELIKGKFPLMKLKEYEKIHVDMVRQVEYIESINSFISAAECPLTATVQKAATGICIQEMGVQKTQTKIKAIKGMSSFAFDKTFLMLATGGPDCILRLWNIIVPEKPTAILQGHSAGITFIFIQETERKVYSLDKNKTVCVWDIRELTLLQTYILFIPVLPDRSSVCAYYNENTRDFIVAGMKIAISKCCPLLNLNITDGETHSKTVSVILYNELFKCIITCGFDSFIIVWDPWTGKRLTLIKMAHTRKLNGEVFTVEITAACFDPKHQLLLTGAWDGSLKIWNFNNGVCIRNLAIETMCEVTAVFWVPGRMLAVGWNRHVTEFSDSGESEYGKGKEWDICHSEDVMAAAKKAPQSLATSSYNGELILWKLETGQPYRRYNVESPNDRVKITYQGQKFQTVKKKVTETDSFYNIRDHKIPGAQPSQTSVLSRKLSIIPLPDIAKRSLTIHCCLFLETRPMSIEYGTLFVALENGIIQVFSHHQLGGFMDSFNAVHMAGDRVVTMTTDNENKYLFVGTVLGYIKVWFVANFCIPEAAKITINESELRLKYPFLMRDRFEGRAKRTARATLKNPKLVNSYKGHLASVSVLVFINETEIILSGSSDKSVRLWTISGRYIGTLGSPVPWRQLSSVLPPSENYKFRIPPDIRRVISSTTLKVLQGGKVEVIRKVKVDSKKSVQTLTDENKTFVYGEPLKEPILGKHFKLPTRNRPPMNPVLDTSLPYVPVYSHLKIHSTIEITRPPTPTLIKMKNLDFKMDSESDDK